jgi:hypothetical protein
MRAKKNSNYKLLKKSFLTVSLAATFCASPAQPLNGKKTINSPALTDPTLVGRSAMITYPSFSVEISYLSTQKLRWKSKNSKGQLREETESISCKALNEHLFFVSWIEQDGFTVSQVIDTKKMEVNSFATSSAPDMPSGRKPIILKGRFEFLIPKN